MAKAKTASKNNPSTRKKDADVHYNSKKVVPVEVITDEMRFIGAQYEDGSVVKGPDGNFVFWSQIKA
jgi:hypothetical protein